MSTVLLFILFIYALATGFGLFIHHWLEFSLLSLTCSRWSFRFGQHCSRHSFHISWRCWRGGGGGGGGGAGGTVWVCNLLDEHIKALRLAHTRMCWGRKTVVKTEAAFTALPLAVVDIVPTVELGAAVPKWCAPRVPWWHLSGFFNPVTAPACKTSRLKRTHIHTWKQYIWWSSNKSAFSTAHSDRNPFTCLCERGEKSFNDFRFGIFVGHFPSDSKASTAVKGLNGHGSTQSWML